MVPCPFCGRRSGQRVLLTGYDDWVSWVCCPCGAKGPIDSPSGCIARWNKRATIPAQIVASDESDPK